MKIWKPRWRATPSGACVVCVASRACVILRVACSSRRFAVAGCEAMTRNPRQRDLLMCMPTMENHVVLATEGVCVFCCVTSMPCAQSGFAKREAGIVRRHAGNPRESRWRLGKVCLRLRVRNRVRFLRHASVDEIVSMTETTSLTTCQFPQFFICFPCLWGVQVSPQS